MSDSSPNDAMQPAQFNNPYAPPLTRSAAEDDEESSARTAYKGIGRAIFFVCLLVIAGLAAFACSKSGDIAKAMGFITILLLLFPVGLRLVNLGRHPALCLLALVPIANFFVLIPCLIFPAGYQDHKKLDLPAKIFAGVLFLILIASVGWAISYY